MLLGVPNATIIRSVSTGGEIDSMMLLLLKTGMIALVTAPLLIQFGLRHRETIRKQWRNLAIMASASTASAILFFTAVERSSASYASIVSLFAPIMLVVLSAKIIKDRIGRRARAGITLAALGGLVAIALPAALNHSVELSMYPVAAILLLINCVTHPLGTIYFRRANEGGVPLSVCVGVFAVVTAAVASLILALSYDVSQVAGKIANLSTGGWLAVAYTALIVSFLSRNLAVKSFEHVGAAVSGGFSYLQTLMSIALPLIILGERLSIEMTAGAFLVLLGVYIAQSHTHKSGPLQRFLNRKLLLTHLRFGRRML